MTKKIKFEIAKSFCQNDLFGFYEPETKADDGLCDGLVIEYARYNFAHKIKGTKGDFFAKLHNPSANFLERIKAYQDVYQPDQEKVIYRTLAETYKLLDNSKFASSDIIFLFLHAIGVDEYPHIIAIKIEHDAGNTSYKIFDPNYGESIEYGTKKLCIEALLALKEHSLEEYNCENLSITAIDSGSILKDIGLITEQIHELKEAKYHYKMIDAVKNGDFDKVLELNKKLKIDYQNCCMDEKIELSSSSKKAILIPEHILDLAVYKLNEEQLIKMIEKNTKLDLTKSFNTVVESLIMANKLSIPVLDALNNKLPDNTIMPEVIKIKALIEGFKSVIEAGQSISYEIENNKLHIKIPSDNPVIADFMLNSAAKLNENTSFELSKESNVDVQIVWATATVTDQEVSSHIDGFYMMQYEKAVELHIDFNVLPDSL